MAKKAKLRQKGWAIRVRAGRVEGRYGFRCFGEHFECWADGTPQTFKTRKDALHFKRSYLGDPNYCRRMSIVRVELREL